MHKRYKYLFVGIIAFVLLIISIVTYVLIPRGKPVKLTLIETETLHEILMDGDIICRLGDRIWSRYFRDVSITDRRFSHMGIIRFNNDNITVIHAEGDTGNGIDYVNEISLDEFIEFARAIGIYRVNDINGSYISNLAAEYLGVPFDWQFDMYDDSKLYCTELLYVILKRLTPEIELNKIYVKRLGKDIIPLDAISNSEHFSEIYFVGSN
jgi:hypothetical protein